MKNNFKFYIIVLVSILSFSCYKKNNQIIADIEIIETEIFYFSEALFYNNNFFVLDKEGNNYIHIYNSDFKIVDSFIERGQGPSELMEPTDFVVYNNNLYILDKQLNCIKKYNLLGTHLETIHLEDSMQPNSFIITDDCIYLTNIVINNKYLISVHNMQGKKIDNFGEIIDYEDSLKKIIQNFSSIESSDDEIYSYFIKQNHINIYRKDGSFLKKFELSELPFKIVNKYNDEDIGTFIVQDMSILNNESFFLIGGGIFEKAFNSIYILNDINKEKYFQIENLKERLGLDYKDSSFCNIFQDDEFVYVTGPKWGKIVKICKDLHFRN